MMKPLGLGYHKINMFSNFCMLYYLENINLTKYRTCRHAHYKPRIGKGRTLVIYKKLRYFPITPKLQRLFISLKTLKYMTLHHSHNAVDGVMMHPSDGKAWKYFNRVHHQFSMEWRNVYFGLCTDRFNPFGSFAALYSCWSVILTVYNLLSGMCMRLEFMFLSTVILDPNNIG